MPALRQVVPLVVRSEQRQHLLVQTDSSIGLHATSLALEDKRIRGEFVSESGIASFANGLKAIEKRGPGTGSANQLELRMFDVLLHETDKGELTSVLMGLDHLSLRDFGFLDLGLGLGFDLVNLDHLGHFFQSGDEIGRLLTNTFSDVVDPFGSLTRLSSPPPGKHAFRVLLAQVPSPYFRIELHGVVDLHIFKVIVQSLEESCVFRVAQDRLEEREIPLVFRI